MEDLLNLDLLDTVFAESLGPADNVLLGGSDGGLVLADELEQDGAGGLDARLEGRKDLCRRMSAGDGPERARPDEVGEEGETVGEVAVGRGEVERLDCNGVGLGHDGTECGRQSRRRATNHDCVRRIGDRGELDNAAVRLEDLVGIGADEESVLTLRDRDVERRRRRVLRRSIVSHEMTPNGDGWRRYSRAPRRGPGSVGRPDRPPRAHR